MNTKIYAFAEHIYPFIHNTFSTPQGPGHTKDLIMTCPCILTSGVCVFFTLVPDLNDNYQVPETVTNKIADTWGVTTMELQEAAFHNLEQLPLRLNKVENQNFYYLDTSSDIFPNVESCRFLSKKSMEQAKEILGGNFYIFPVSVWKSYLIGEKEAGEMDPSTLLTYMLAKGGMPKDVLLRHGYLYRDGGLSIAELSASRDRSKKVEPFRKTR